MKASEFKATCLALLDDVAATGTPVVVTKRGKPVARLLPMEPPRSMEGSVRFLVDEAALLEPIDVAWNAIRP